MGKGEIARNEQTLSVWKNLKFVVWERGKTAKLKCFINLYTATEIIFALLLIVDAVPCNLFTKQQQSFRLN